MKRHQKLIRISPLLMGLMASIHAIPSEANTCTPGTYFDGLNCVQAPLGNYVDIPQATRPTAANYGYFVPTLGASFPNAAEIGYYVPTTAASTQTAASLGYYVPVASASTQLAADYGYYVGITGASAPSSAELGYYVNTTAASAQTAASAGYYVAGTAASAQTAASRGYFVSTSGATTQTAAPEAYYVATVAATAPTPASFSYIVGQLASIDEPLINNGSGAASAPQLDLTGKTVKVINSFTSSRAINFGNSSGIDVISGKTANLSGDLSNSGALSKLGAGQLSLSGNVYGNGSLNVLAGVLQIDGNVQNSLNVSPGATLQGSGSLVGNILNRGNFILGSGVSNLRITGNLQSDSGATFNVQASPTMAPLTVSGTANLQGSITYNLGQGSYQAGVNYSVIQAQAGLTSSLQLTNTTYAGYLLTSYTDGNSLGFRVVYRDLAQSASTPNRYSVAQALDQEKNVATGDMANVISSLSSATATVADSSFNQMGSTQVLGYAWIEQQKFDMANRGIINRLNHHSLPNKLANLKQEEFNGWISLQGMGASYSTPTLPAKQNISGSGIQLGTDYKLLTENGKTIFGLSASNFNSNNNPVNGGGISATSYLYQAYAKYEYNNYSVDYILGYSNSSGNQSRYLSLPDEQRVAQSTLGANGLDNQLVFSKLFRVSNRYLFRPFLGVGYRTINVKGYQEQGAESLNLNVNSFKLSAKTYILGLHASTIYEVQGYKLQPSYELAVRTQQGSDTTNIIQKFSGLSESNTQTVHLGRYTYPSMTLSLEASKTNNFSANILLRGDKQSDFWIWQTQLGIRYRW